MVTTTSRFDVLLRSEQTDDHVAIIDITVPAGWAGPPLHHHDLDESFYILEGELTFQLGDAHAARRLRWLAGVVACCSTNVLSLWGIELIASPRRASPAGPRSSRPSARPKSMRTA